MNENDFKNLGKGGNMNANVELWVCFRMADKQSGYPLKKAVLFL